MFYDNFVSLCNNVSKSPSAVASELGLSRASVNGWKHGKMPTDANQLKIANYFGISVDVLLGRDPNIILTITKDGNAVVTGKERPHIPLTGVAMSGDRKYSQFLIGKPENDQKNEPSSEEESLSEVDKKFLNKVRKLNPQYLKVANSQIDALLALQEEQDK